jgi:hypothetical protein
MQGDRCMRMHDVTMMQKEKNKQLSNIRNFSGSLHRCLHTGHGHLPAVHHPHVKAYPGMSCMVYCNQTFM